MMSDDSGRDTPSPEPKSESHRVQMSHKWTDTFGLHVARVAGGVKRGLGLGRPTLTIMNAAADAPVLPALVGAASGGETLADLGLHLQRAALGLCGDFVVTGEDGVSLVDYDAMRTSDAFAAYVTLTQKLRCADMPTPAAIGDREAQLAFWLNMCAFPSVLCNETHTLCFSTPASCEVFLLTLHVQVQLSRHARQAATRQNIRFGRFLRQHRVRGQSIFCIVYDV